MGCASSGPVAKAVESVKDLAGKEGKAVQDFGSATKDTLVSGVHHVNEAVGSAFKSAEQEVGNLASKATGFLGHAEDEAKKEAEQLESNANEAISDAETVVMSEVGNLQEDVEDEVKESEKLVIMDGDNLILEDIEHFDHLGEALEKTEKKSMEAAGLKDVVPGEESKKDE